MDQASLFHYEAHLEPWPPQNATTETVGAQLIIITMAKKKSRRSIFII